ncbi:uncharacterized protein LOC113932967 isoform X2 [Zalophus californianus]|uniref:Uncharacterized protein LOC113932967 isoform X2 n=1 Tax=Zalophus californianus TaxID=9704 RepID=A0A6P9FCV4_ZALCA|nr:uncharacterized protein LOC113932967 isoform X2 [Zalophus californianus]
MGRGTHRRGFRRGRPDMHFEQLTQVDLRGTSSGETKEKPLQSCRGRRMRLSRGSEDGRSGQTPGSWAGLVPHRLGKGEGPDVGGHYLEGAEAAVGDTAEYGEGCWPVGSWEHAGRGESRMKGRVPGTTLEEAEKKRSWRLRREAGAGLGKWLLKTRQLQEKILGENLKENAFSLKNIYSQFRPSLENVDPTTELHIQRPRVVTTAQ